MKSPAPKTITIKTEHLIVGVLLFIVLATAAYSFLPVIAGNSAKPPAGPETFARWGAQAFLSTDVEKGREAWETSVCELSSEQGCEVFKSVLAPMVWGGVERNGTRQACLASSASLTREIETESVVRQFWSVSLECSNLVTGETQTGDVMSVVVKTADGWKFERIGFEEEANDAE